MTAKPAGSDDRSTCPTEVRLPNVTTALRRRYPGIKCDAHDVIFSDGSRKQKLQFSGPPQLLIDYGLVTANILQQPFDCRRRPYLDGCGSHLVGGFMGDRAYVLHWQCEEKDLPRWAEKAGTAILKRLVRTSRS